MKFTLYWLNGKKEVIEGDDIADAFAHAGHGGGSIKAVDFYTDENSKDYEFKDGKWKYLD